MFRPVSWSSSVRFNAKDISQKLHEPMHKCEILSFKMYSIKYMLKYKMQIFFLSWCYDIVVTGDDDFNVVGY